MKTLLIGLLSLTTLTAFGACPKVSGTYDLESMGKYCTVKTGGPLELEIDYNIGDDSPLYTVLPETINDVGVGYIMPGHELSVKVSKDCQQFTIIFPEKDRENVILKDLTYQNISKLETELKATSEDILNEGEEAKANLIQARGIKLSQGKDSLKMKINQDYVAENKRNKKRKMLRFEEYNCEFPKK